MNNRLNLQDIVDLLASQTGRTKKETELFLRTFIAKVSEGVFRDKIVKVKGLGTFKIIKVDRRESVNVNTKERFIIPEHYKFSFLPDKDLKESVNKPFSFFETTEINEGADFSSIPTPDNNEETDEEQEATEVAEINDEVVEETVITESPVEEEPSTEPEEVIPEVIPPAVEESQEATITKVPVVEKLDPVAENNDTQTNNAPVEKKEEKPKNKGAILWLSILLALVLVIVALIFLLRNNKPADVVERQTSAPMVEEVIPVQPPQPDSLVTSVQEEPEIITPPATPSKPEVIARVKIDAGSRLTLIALEYYKSKVFWVYLYEYNKAIIKDPNNIPIGTEIAIPSPHLYDIDVNDRKSLERASILQTEILEGKR